MSSHIIGREREVALLKKQLASKEPQLIAVYGRRRIGKTHLIREFYRDKGVYIQFTGVQDGSMAEQLANLHDELCSLFGQWTDKPPPKDWREAFNRLVQSVKPLLKEQRVVIFFDEVPWLASTSGFLKALEYSWNQHLGALPGLVVVLCGSSSSWMIQQVIQNKGGLHGRLTAKIHLQPFSLLETEQFLHHRGVRLSRHQIIELYMVLGGVAQYLKAVPPGLSTSQIVHQLCFSPQGLLFREFYPLYRSLFDQAERYVAIVQSLASQRYGLSQPLLLQKAGLSSGGSATKLLRELEESGLILYLPSLAGKKLATKKKGGIYRLIDEYSLFYLHWIQNAAPSILTGLDPHYWTLQQQSQRWAIWAGYTFENICFRHIHQIKQALGLAAVATIESSWLAPEACSGGAQIDLVIDRADRCINLCEMKFHSRPLVINRQLAEQLERKRKLFGEATATPKSLFTTLISSHGIAESSSFLHVIDQQITMEQLFS